MWLNIADSGHVQVYGPGMESMIMKSTKYEEWQGLSQPVNATKHMA